MANPTTAFGWVMPTATDLVTDLPADFAVFGQGVDTSMQYLLGGTTGQVLSKTSGTNMAFTWINNDTGDITGVTAGNGISVTSPTGPVPTVAIDTTVTVDKTTAQTLTNKTLTSPALTTPTISTATTNGDILYGTGSGALQRLGIGSASQVLSVSGGIPAWATPSSGAMSVVKARTTFTNVATTTTTFDGVFTSSYRNYLIVFDNCSAGTQSDDFLMQFRYAGPTTQATGYYGINIEATVGSATVTNAAPNNSSSMQLSDDAGSSGNTGSGYAWVIEAGNSSTKSRIYGSYLESVTAGGGFFANGATDARIYTGFILSSSSSNITGTVTVYGLVTA